MGPRDPHLPYWWVMMADVTLVPIFDHYTAFSDLITDDPSQYNITG